MPLDEQQRQQLDGIVGRMVAEREQAAATAVIDPGADTADATPADIPAADEGE